MPYQDLTEGLYIVVQNLQAKGVERYRILDVGNRFQHPPVRSLQQAFIYQSAPRIQIDWLQITGP